MNLATIDIAEGIPKAFQMPNEEFLQYANAHPDLLWVKKSNEHRGITVQKLEELKFQEGKHFVQQYISNPLLIDGRLVLCNFELKHTISTSLGCMVHDGLSHHFFNANSVRLHVYVIAMQHFLFCFVNTIRAFEKQTQKSCLIEKGQKIL